MRTRHVSEIRVRHVCVFVPPMFVDDQSQWTRVNLFAHVHARSSVGLTTTYPGFYGRIQDVKALFPWFFDPRNRICNQIKSSITSWAQFGRIYPHDYFVISEFSRIPYSVFKSSIYTILEAMCL